MRKSFLVLVTLLTVGMLLIGCGVPKEVQQELSQLRTENSQLKTEKTQWQAEKAELEKEVQQELSQLRTENSQLKTGKTQWQAEKAELEKEVADLSNQVSELTKKVLKDPTYEEAASFIKEDKTNEEVPQDHATAAMLVAENAGKTGINCYWVIARTSLGGFNFVGFNTTDRGWIYFCNSGTCGNQEVKLEVGKKLYQLNPQWGTAGFDDTIISIHHLPL